MTETVAEFIERVERDVERWQAEGLSAPAALNQAWAVALLCMEAEGELPKGYLRARTLDTSLDPTEAAHGLA